MSEIDSIGLPSPKPGRENGPWRMNLDFTIRGASREDAEHKADAINRAARRVGCGIGFTDLSEPDDGR